jgi:hypothetical protein
MNPYPIFVLLPSLRTNILAKFVVNFVPNESRRTKTGQRFMSDCLWMPNVCECPDPDKTARHESISRLRSSVFVQNEYFGNESSVQCLWLVLSKVDLYSPFSFIIMINQSQSPFRLVATLGLGWFYSIHRLSLSFYDTFFLGPAAFVQCVCHRSYLQPRLFRLDAARSWSK